MKRFLLLCHVVAIFVVLPAVCSHAATHGQDWNEQGAGIITPNVATGAVRYSNFKYAANGDMIVCPANPGSSDCPGNRWVPIQKAIPAGRVYVGFRLSSGYYGATSLDIFWR